MFLAGTLVRDTDNMAQKPPTESNKINLKHTPKFDHPPVVETVLGVQFKPLTELRLTHYGLFYQYLQEGGFVKTEDHPPLLRQIEQKEDFMRLFEMPPMVFMQTNIPRIWYLSEDAADGQRLIQLQIDRFIQNWRRMNLESTKYPSYEENRKEFQNTFGRFLKFVEKENIGQVEPNQCEVIYVNRIPIQDVAQAAATFRKCFTSFVPAKNLKHVPTEPDGIGFNCSFWIESLNGRLFIQASTASQIPGVGKVIDLRLTARGAPASDDLAAVMEWLDFGHYFVVNAFADITSEEMHREWGKIK